MGSHIQDFSANSAGKSVFSKVDLVQGYYQVPMAPGDIRKMAIITPFGLWEFTRMPFGLKNATQTFQRLMDTVCADLEFAFAYLDAILIARTTEAEHYDHLTKLFKRLAANDLAINPAKCVFRETSLDFPGHFVDPAINPAKCVFRETGPLRRQSRHQASSFQSGCY